MKHIVFIHLLNDLSGSPKVLSQVITNFKNNGYKVSLYTGKSSKGFLTGLVHQHRFYFYKRFTNKYLTLVSFFCSQFILFFKLLKYANKDVVFYINTMLPFGAGLAGKCLAKPVIYHVHETNIKPLIFKSFLRLIIKYSATKIIYVSRTLKILESFKNKKETVIYNALPKSFVNSSIKNRYKPLDEDGVFNVFMICSLKVYKGINEFLKISENCKHVINIKFTLILNATKSEIDNYFKNRSIPGNLTILPAQTKLKSFYEKASLVLNLSLTNSWIETFGLTILEAMAFSIPVIVPPVGGPSELITDGKEGYLMDSSDTDAIAEKIISLSRHTEICLVLSKNAFQRSLDFSEKQFNTKVLAAVD